MKRDPWYERLADWWVDHLLLMTLLGLGCSLASIGLLILAAVTS